MPLAPHFGPFFKPLGPLLGRPWASLGRLLAALGALLGALGALLGRSWAALGRSWGASGPVFGASWCSSAVSWRPWALPGCSGDAPGPFPAALGALLGTQMSELSRALLPGNRFWWGSLPFGQFSGQRTSCVSLSGPIPLVSLHGTPICSKIWSKMCRHLCFRLPPCAFLVQCS